MDKGPEFRMKAKTTGKKNLAHNSVELYFCLAPLPKESQVSK